MAKFSYALTAAATRGSAGVEPLDVGGVDGAWADVGVELVEVLAVVVARLPDGLGPGFGELLLHPARRAAVIAVAASTAHRDLRTRPPFGGDTAALPGGDAAWCLSNGPW